MEEGGRKGRKGGGRAEKEWREGGGRVVEESWKKDGGRKVKKN